MVVLLKNFQKNKLLLVLVVKQLKKLLKQEVWELLKRLWLVEVDFLVN